MHAPIGGFSISPAVTAHNIEDVTGESEAGNDFWSRPLTTASWVVKAVNKGRLTDDGDSPS